MKKKQTFVIFIMFILVGIIGAENYNLTLSKSRISDKTQNDTYQKPIIAAPGDFVSVWNTSITSSGSSATNQITLPLEFGGNYDFTVNWGDTTSINIDSWDHVNRTHTYSSSGEYTITINGTLTGWRFNSGGDKLKLLEISQWGSLNLGNNDSYFEGCENLKLTAIDALNLTGTTTFLRAFTLCKNLGDTGNMNGWDVSNITDMDYMFATATNFNQPIGDWNVSSVTTMYAMFSNTNDFNQNIGAWNVSSVTNMNNMFLSAIVFNHSLENWEVSNLINMGNMFKYASSFNQPLDSWDVSSVTDMSSLFYGATSFNQELNNWDVSSVTDMTSLFYRATTFNQPVSSWHVSSVTKTRYMFYQASSFNELVGNWDVSSVTDMYGMFYHTTSFNQELNNWDVSSVTTMNSMFYNATSFNQPIDDWDVSSVTTMDHMFRNASVFNQPLDSWDVSSVDAMNYMFKNAFNFNQDLGAWDVSQVTGMYQMFDGMKLSPLKYDLLLKGWSQLTLQTGTLFGAGNSQYMAEYSARQSIIDSYGWVITDDGQAPFPTISSLTPTPWNNSIGLTWVVSAEDIGLLPIDEFYIFRSLSSEGPFTYLTSCPTSSFTDINVIPGIEYYYRVQYSTSLSDGPMSNYVSAIPEGETGDLSEDLLELAAYLEGNVTELREILDELGYSIGDTDYDGLDDLDEILLGTSITCVDTDCDNLNDAFEVKIGTDPLDDDSDDDGWYDGVEVSVGTNPLDASDYPNNTSGTSSDFPFGWVIGGGLGVLGVAALLVVVIKLKKK